MTVQKLLKTKGAKQNWFASYEGKINYYFHFITNKY